MLRLIGITILCTCLSTPSLAEKASSKQCLRWEKKIDHYTKLRQRGGSASKMNKWQKTRKKYKQRYQDGGCAKGKSMGSL